MNHHEEDRAAPKCPFCCMQSKGRFLRIPVCEICRDQLYDFLWASAVQAAVTLMLDLGSFVFLVEEVLLFVVLVLVKHRVTPPWERKRRYERHGP